MKLWSPLLLLPILVLWGCKKDVTPSNGLDNVILSENWTYTYPENQTVLMMDVEGDEILIVTASKKGSKKAKIHTYLLTGKGEEIANYTIVDPNYGSNYIHDHPVLNRKGDWVKLFSLSHQLFVNVRTGSSYIEIDDVSLTSDSSYAYYLTNDDGCFYIQEDELGNHILFKWDLSDNSRSSLDTIATDQGILHRIHVLGEFTPHVNSWYRQNLVFLEQQWETVNYVSRFSLLGYAYRHDMSESWKGDFLFREFLTNQVYRPTFHGGYCYFIMEEILYCLDPARQQVVWKRSIGSNHTSEILFNQNTLYIAVADRGLHSIDLANGQVNWLHHEGQYAAQMAIINGTLSFVSPRDVDENELFSDQTNQLHFVDIRNGSEIFRSDDPLSLGASVHVNNMNKGLNRVITANNNHLLISTNVELRSVTVELVQ